MGKLRDLVIKEFNKPQRGMFDLLVKRKVSAPIVEQDLYSADFGKANTPSIISFERRVNVQPTGRNDLTDGRYVEYLETGYTINDIKLVFAYDDLELGDIITYLGEKYEVKEAEPITADDEMFNPEIVYYDCLMVRIRDQENV